MNQCLICNSPSEPLFKKRLLQKYDVQYFQCTTCKFVHTENPYWLQEAYSEAISRLDTGIMVRNLKFAKIVPVIINLFSDKKGRFLDYGGGYGIFVRMMRDKGFDFYRQDAYCQNLLAQNYDINDLPPEEQHFNLITAFEVFEHVTDPHNTVTQMLGYTDTIVFSTSIIPNQTEALSNWWYLSPETGQHVSLYTVASLQKLAERHKAYLYTNGHNFHMLTRSKKSGWFFALLKVVYQLRNWLGSKSDYSQIDRTTHMKATELK